jgi:hypothetical protein
MISRYVVLHVQTPPLRMPIRNLFLNSVCNLIPADSDDVWYTFSRPLSVLCESSSYAMLNFDINREASILVILLPQV